jgi:very-short-patch-repair endonuclease
VPQAKSEGRERPERSAEKGRRPAPGSWVDAYPDIARDWDRERNGVVASDVRITPERPYWWRCSAGHSYEAAIRTRVRSHGCKICRAPLHGERIRQWKLARSRSLADAHPHLVTEWHPTKNGDRTPATVTRSSHLLLWWRCAAGHEWQSTPQRRGRGDGCPECSRASASERTRTARLKRSGRSFADAYPELLAEWDYERSQFDPTKIAPKSNVRAAWICKLGHRWEATVTNRTNNRSGCPECVPQSSRLEMALLAELRAIYANVKWRTNVGGAECDLLLPDKALGIEVDGGYWHRDKAEKDVAKAALFSSLGVTLIRARDATLPDLAGVVVRFENRDDEYSTVRAVLTKVAEVAPDEAILAYLADGRRRNEAGYKELVARLPAPPQGETLADTYPQVAAQWDYEANAPLTPELFSNGSMQKVAWVCDEGHRWSAVIKNRTALESGCPVCARSGQSARTAARWLKQAGTLAERDPEMLAWWDYGSNTVDPTKISARWTTDVNWRCPKGHVFRRSVAEQCSVRRCPECFSLARSPLSGDLAKLPFRLVTERDPDLVSRQSTEALEWECPQGHRFELAPRFAVSRSVCPVCAGYENPSGPRPMGRSFAERRPDLIDEWADTDHLPQATGASNRIKVLWRCRACGHEWRAAADDRAGGSGCPVCGRAKASNATRQKKLAKSGSLAFHHPELLREFDAEKNAGLSPDDLSPSSHQKVWWRCEQGHEWFTSPNQRILRGRVCGCPKCANVKRLAGLKEGNSRRGR